MVSVYPSYPADVPPEQRSSTLIASYCWTQGAERMGALINDGLRKPELIDMVLRDLATAHGVTVEWLKQYYTRGTTLAGIGCTILSPWVRLFLPVADLTPL